MHAPKSTLRPPFLLALTLLALLAGSCGKKSSDDPQPTLTNAFAGTYVGKLVTTDGVNGKQATFISTVNPQSLQIRAGKNASEVIIALGNKLNDFSSDTWTAITSGTTLTVSKQTDTGGNQQEGTGTLTGNELKLVIQSTGAQIGAVQHTITATRQ